MKKNKNIILLAVCAAILLGLIAALVVLRGLPEPEAGQENGESPSDWGEFSESDQAQTVYAVQSPLVRMDIRRPEPDFDYSILTEEPDAEAPVYTVSDMDGLPLNHNLLSSVAVYAPSLIYTSVLAEDEGTVNLADYGLKENQAVRVALTFQDGSAVDFAIGDPTPDGTGVYLSHSGSLFVVPEELARPYLCTRMDFLSLAVTSATGAAQQYDKLTLSGGGRLQPLVVEPDSPPGQGDAAVYSITAPIRRRLKASGSDAQIQSIFSIIADGVAALRPDAQALADLGLAEPYATVSVLGAGQGGFTLHATAPDQNGDILLLREGVPVVYRMASSNAPWLEVTYFDLASPYPVSVPMERLRELELELDGQVHRFSVSSTDGEGEAEAQTAYYALYNGGEIEYDLFYTLVLEVLDAPAYFYNDTPLPEAPDPLLRVTYRYNDGAPDDTVTVYPGPPRQLYVRRGEEPIEFLISSTYPDQVRDKLSLIINVD